jgi:TetR/AcrR family transcriptional regulator, fatty acid metabolism regulator protein
MNRKDQLIHTAIEIINEIGYQNFTIRELAHRQNISEAAVYRHFNSKNEIVSGVLEYFEIYFRELRQTISTQNLTALQSIEYYIKNFLAYYESHPEMITVLTSFDLLSREKGFNPVISKIVDLRLAFLMELFQKAIDQKEVDGLISAEAMAHIMFGTMISVSLDWKLHNYGFSLTGKIESFTCQMKEILLK